MLELADIGDIDSSGESRTGSNPVYSRGTVTVLGAFSQGQRLPNPLRR